MKYIKKAFKLISLILIITLASIGLGFNAAIMPSFKRHDSNEATIELAESNEEESETENQEIP